MGSMRAARRAGYHPATIPLSAAAPRLHAIVEARSGRSSAERPGRQREQHLRRGEARRPAADGDEARFGQHLQRDVAPRRAERPPHADLARPLRHRHERRVRHDDDGGEQRHDRNRGGRGADAFRDALNEPARGLGREDVEAVRLPGRQLAPGAHGDPHAVLGRRHPLRVGSLGEDLQAVRGAEHPLERLQRNPHVAVERNAAARALAILRPDDFEPAAADAHDPAQRIDAGEQGVDDVHPYHRHLGRPVFFLAADEPAAVDPELADGEQRRGGAVDRGVLELPPAGGDVGPPLRDRSVENLPGGVALQEAHVGPGDRAVAREPVREFLPGQVRRGDAREDEGVAAERPRARALRRAGEAVETGHHQRHGADRHRDRQRAQARAQGVGQAAAGGLDHHRAGNPRAPLHPIPRPPFDLGPVVQLTEHLEGADDHLRAVGDALDLDVESPDDPGRDGHEDRASVLPGEDARPLLSVGARPQDDGLQRHGAHVLALGGQHFGIARQARPEPRVGGDRGAPPFETRVRRRPCRRWAARWPRSRRLDRRTRGRAPPRA